MRIPVIDGRRVDNRPIGTPYSKLNHDSGMDDVARGIGQVGQAVAQVDENIRRAREKADAVNVTDAETELQRRWTAITVGDSSDPANPKPGYFSTNGKQAAEHSAKALEEMEKQRRDIAEKLANDNQRRLFLMRTGGLYESQRKSIENHVAQQTEVAAVAAVKARGDAALAAIVADFANPEAVAKHEASVEGPIRALQVSQEDGDAKVAAWRAEVAKVRLTQHLAVKDWRGAEALLAQSRDKLGPASAQFEKQIATVRQDQQAEVAAAALVEGARDPGNGRVDTAKAIAEIDSVPEGPLRDEVRQRLEHRVAKEEKAWKQQVDTRYTRAFSAYLSADSDISAIDSRDKAWLIQNAPDEWQKILSRDNANRAADRAAARERRAASGGGRGETFSQREALGELKADIVEHPEKYRAMDFPEFSNAWGHRLSDSGYNRATTMFAAAKKPPRQGDVSAGFIKAEVDGTPSLKDKRKASTFKSLMYDEITDFEAQHSRAPNRQELAIMRTNVFRTEPGLLGVFPDKEVLKTREERRAERATTTPPPASNAPKKVDVINENGEPGRVAADRVEAWLKANPKRRRK